MQEGIGNFTWVYIISTQIQRKIVNISLPIIFAYVLDAQKIWLIEMGLLSTYNICFVEK